MESSKFNELVANSDCSEVFENFYEDHSNFPNLGRQLEDNSTTEAPRICEI